MFPLFVKNQQQHLLIAFLDVFEAGNSADHFVDQVRAFFVLDKEVVIHSQMDLCSEEILLVVVGLAVLAKLA